MRPESPSAPLRRPSPGAAGARLAELYNEHARMAYGISRLILRDADEAEDAVQQVFLSAYRALLTGTEPRDAGAWLATIARNEARGRITTRRLRPLGFDGDLEPATATLEEQANTRADLAELRAQIAALPEKQREAVVLRDLYGLRYEEVARALNTSRPAVEALLFRGRRRLQRRLRPGLAAGVLVVPLALRESLAYAVPGFAAGGASSAGVLAKLASVPIAAKLAAAGVTVGLVGSTGVIAERELQGPPEHAVPQLVEQDTLRLRPVVSLPIAAAKPAVTPALRLLEDARNGLRELAETDDDAAEERDDDRGPGGGEDRDDADERDDDGVTARTDDDETEPGSRGHNEDDEDDSVEDDEDTAEADEADSSAEES